MSKQCCEWHDHLPEEFADPNATPENSFDECGLAGMGTPSVCCRKCPMAAWYTDGSRNANNIFYTKEIMALPVDERP